MGYILRATGKDLLLFERMKSLVFGLYAWTDKDERHEVKEAGTGGEGVLVTAGPVVIEDLAIENAKGDALKVTGANGVTVRRVRVDRRTAQGVRVSGARAGQDAPGLRARTRSMGGQGE